MKLRMVASLTALLASAGLALGQSPYPTTLPANDPPAKGQPAQEPPGKTEGGHTEGGPAEGGHAEGSHEEEEEHEAHYRFWVRAEYLLWWIRETGFVPLATLGSVSDDRPGAIGQPGTRLLFGGLDTQNPTRNGGRFTIGGWLSDEECTGLEIAYWFLGDRSEGSEYLTSGGPKAPVFARPFYDALANREDADLVTYPGVAGGALTIHHTTFFQGGEANAVWSLARCKNYNIELLAGFRYMNLDDDVDIGENSRVAPGSPLQGGSAIAVRDHFGTSNDFYGGQLGLRGEFRYEHWFMNATAKVGLGDVNQEVNINGSTAVTPAGGTTTVTPAGLLAVASNSGSHSRDVFGFVPEVGVSAGYQFNDHIRFSVSYSFIYWNDVARAANQIDRTVNVSQVPTSVLFGTPGGPARPGFIFDSTDFWAQGVSLALEFRY
jgi:hypothetical protein